MCTWPLYMRAHGRLQNLGQHREVHPSNLAEVALKRPFRATYDERWIKSGRNRDEVVSYAKTIGRDRPQCGRILVNAFRIGALLGRDRPPKIGRTQSYLGKATGPTMVNLAQSWSKPGKHA